MPWRYRGAVVSTSADAEIPFIYREKGVFATIVQQLLNSLPPWEDDRPHVYTRAFTEQGRMFPSTVVPVDERPIIWAHHGDHQGREAARSPFVAVEGQTPPTASFTIHLDGSVEQPVVTHAYPGLERPLLPWQIDAKGEYQESIDFWRQHAYVYYRSIVAPGTETTFAPLWFTQ